MKRISGMLLLCAAFSLNTCVSYYKIQDQREDPKLSVAVMRMAVPFTIFEGNLLGKTGGIKSQYRAKHGDAYKRKVMVFTNVLPGDYYIGQVYSESRQTTATYGRYRRTTWRTLRLFFEDPRKVKSDQKIFKIPPGKIIYLGNFILLPKDKMKQFYKSAAKMGKTKEMIDGSAAYTTWIWSKDRSKKKEYYLLRTDHPKLVGIGKSLNSELRMLNAVFSNRNDIPVCKKMAAARIAEISREIKKLPVDNKAKKQR